MRRKNITLLTATWLVLAMVSATAGLGKGSPPPGTLKAVALSAPAHELFLRIEGGYSFQTVQASEGRLFVDLKGVKAGGVATKGQWSDGLLTGYRLVQYTDAAGQPVVRVQLDMRHAQPLKAQPERAGLRLIFGEGPQKSTAAASAEAPAPITTASRTLPTASPNGPAEVSGVSIKSGGSGETYIDVLTSRPTAFRVLQLKSPARVVVDLQEAHNAASQRSYSAQSPLLKGVRVGQFHEKSPAIVRVVADLSGDPAFDVHAQPGGVRLELKSRSVARQTAPATTTQVAKPTEEKSSQVAVTAPAAQVPTKPLEHPEVTTHTATVATKVETAQTEPKPAAQPDVQSALPDPQGAKEVSAAPRPEPPAATPESLQAAKAAKILGGSEVLAAAPQGPAPAAVPSAEEKPKYTGEPISLNLKDVDLKDFFRLIHEISGLNIIVDPNVGGAVTLVLDTVPWDQALDIVLKNNGLGKTLEGNVLRIARVDTLTAEQEGVKKLLAAREETMPLVTVFHPVNYAKAATVASLLKSWVGGGALSKRGNVLVDDRANTLIVSDIQSQIPIIESIIAKLDKKTKQVQIEARIIRANADFARTLSSTLQVGYLNKSGSTIQTGASGSATITETLPKPRPVLITDQINSGFGIYAISNVGARYILNSIISAAEQKSQAKTISAPSIVTQNNVPGTVVQGAQIPIQTNINNTITVQYINAALTLTVTPQVTEDGNIFLVISVVNASPGAVVPGANPVINTQSATTQVLVPDGGTVVFGGVTVTSRSKAATYVPLLGNIPIVGHLFKTSNVQDSDQQLLFFVSPKVLPG